MAEMKRCTQCGLLKSVDDFRKYTYAREKNTDGRYRLCKQCETTNTTYRRLCKRLAEINPDGYNSREFGPACTEEYQRLSCMKERIEALYDMLAARGLRVPNKVDATPEKSSPEAKVLHDVDQLFAMYGDAPTGRREPAPARKSTVVLPEVEVPDELQAWLDADPKDWRDKELSPEYLQETIYESLKAKYRPQIDVDRQTFMPIYDDTYKDVLNQILRKFDDYEEQYAGEEEDYGTDE